MQAAKRSFSQNKTKADHSERLAKVVSVIDKAHENKEFGVIKIHIQKGTITRYACDFSETFP